ncbi:MAG: hypothetical protein WC668_04745 [Patescibacteria group bacterium]
MMLSMFALMTIKSKPKKDLHCESEGPDTSASSRRTRHEGKFDACIKYHGEILFETNHNFKSKKEALAWARKLIKAVKGMSETELEEMDSLKLYYLAGGS